ncbi:hypothetical protein [Smaragdicoccus niigatensis]|uniref:hypothetical protein n=1 Tax=Smaragdicoccus niigatensis TaxID=359359 RepID=UPI0003A340D2|nr:hypothetical protein [Smaragdicoccus niigatensis]
MKRRTLAWGIGGVIVAEIVAIGAALWPLVLFGGGLAALGAIIALVVDTMREPEVVARRRTFDNNEGLEHWLAKTQVLVAWADGTAADWDRHIRPIIGREFQLAVGGRPDRKRGEFVFGPSWMWVDPLGHGTGQAPGREGLDKILQRLEWITTGEAAA